MSEDMWHVQIEPGDVKTVTLEQMDDMYRLDLIQGTTLVWQPGMPKALPLSVVAGIEEEESDVMEIEPELIPEPLPPPPSIPPPSSFRQHTITPPPVAAAPAPAAQVPVAPSLPTPDFYSPESLRPITMSDSPSFRPQPSGVMGRVLLGVAIAAGILITLYRNDLVRPVAASTGSEAAYKEIEAALGSPGFGTTRSVASFSAMLNPDPEPVSAATPTSAARTTATQQPSDASEDSSDHEPSPTSAADSKQADSSAANNTRARSAPPRRTSPPRRKSTAPASKKLKSFKGNEYDPMNAKL